MRANNKTRNGFPQSFSPNLPDRFWRKVKKGRSCWKWNGAVGNNGYGRINTAGRGMPIESAHRVVWVLTFGPIPEGKFVLHRCDNKLCVNPKHLWIGTQADNMRDMKKKGRGCIGEKNGQARLNRNTVLKIRKVYSTGKFSQSKVATMFGISRCHVHQIASRRNWNHI